MTEVPLASDMRQVTGAGCVAVRNPVFDHLIGEAAIEVQKKARVGKNAATIYIPSCCTAYPRFNHADAVAIVEDAFKARGYTVTILRHYMLEIRW